MFYAEVFCCFNLPGTSKANILAILLQEIEED